MGLSEEEKVDDEKVKSGVSRNALMLICVGPMSGILLKTDWVSNLISANRVTTTLPTYGKHRFIGTWPSLEIQMVNYILHS